MVCEAMGLVSYGDKGNMTPAEIDATMKVFTEAKKDGQFRAFWKTFDESVNLMSSGEVVIQSMWSPAVTKVRSLGIPCTYQPLKEGYRSWGGGLGLSAGLEGRELDAAYEYINWYMSGWVSSVLMRQGYYSAVPTWLSHTCPLTNGASGSKVRLRPVTSAIRSATSWSLRALCVTAAPSTTVWAALLCGTLSWTRTATWSASGTSSSRPKLKMTSTPTITTGKAPRPSLGARMQGGLLALPLALVLLAFLAVPVGIVVAVSFWDYNDWEVIPDFVTFNYVELFTSRLTYILYAKTLKFAFLVWAFTLVIGVVVAYVLTFRIRSTKWQIVLFLVCTIPFWTSNIIRMIAWIPVLSRHGLVNGFLSKRASSVAPSSGCSIPNSPSSWLLLPLRPVHGGPGVQLHGAHRPACLKPRETLARAAFRPSLWSFSPCAALAWPSAASLSWRWSWGTL